MEFTIEQLEKEIERHNSDIETINTQIETKHKIVKKGKLTIKKLEKQKKSINDLLNLKQGYITMMNKLKEKEDSVKDNSKEVCTHCDAELSESVIQYCNNNDIPPTCYAHQQRYKNE